LARFRKTKKGRFFLEILNVTNMNANSSESEDSIIDVWNAKMAELYESLQDANTTRVLPVETKGLLEELRKWIEPNPHNKCWIWTGTTNNEYGVASNTFSKWTIAEPAVHRLVYRLLIGEIPQDYVLHHSCFQKRCCNPEHLVPMTAEEHRKLHAEDAASMRAYIDKGIIG
jgi:hypothetical protein